LEQPGQHWLTLDGVAQQTPSQGPRNPEEPLPGLQQLARGTSLYVPVVQISPCWQHPVGDPVQERTQHASDVGRQPSPAQHFSPASQHPFGSEGQEEPPAAQHCVLGMQPSPRQHFSFSGQHHFPSQTSSPARGLQQPSNSVQTSPPTVLQHPSAAIGHLSSPEQQAGLVTQ
jgi:hypothetical protein